MRRIVYTRPDGGVSVCLPAQECVDWLSNGGYWDGRGICLDEQIERQIAAGHRERAARRFVRVLDEGGCTTSEAYDIIRDRDCGHLGTGFGLWDYSDLPDRWFRDAWVRSHNGGPISIDMAKARHIQFKRIKSAVNRENRRRDEALENIGPLAVHFGSIRDRIHKAQDETDLRRIWPEELI